jgi:hypothetical protein
MLLLFVARIEPEAFSVPETLRGELGGFDP